MQMKLGKLLAETKTGEKRQIEPEKDGRGQKYEFELAGYHFFGQGKEKGSFWKEGRNCTINVP